VPPLAYASGDGGAYGGGAFGGGGGGAAGGGGGAASSGGSVIPRPPSQSVNTPHRSGLAGAVNPFVTLAG
jgi:hypothetical protein